MTGGGGFDFFCHVWVGTIPLTEGSSAAGRANCANDRQLSYCWLGLVNRFQLRGASLSLWTVSIGRRQNNFAFRIGRFPRACAEADDDWQPNNEKSGASKVARHKDVSGLWLDSSYEFARQSRLWPANGSHAPAQTP